MPRENIYYPRQREFCHWSRVTDQGGCTFCFFNASKRCDVKPWTTEEMIDHFNVFTQTLEADHMIQGNDLFIAVNGSWFPQIEPEVRRHITTWAMNHAVKRLGYELRATMVNPIRAEEELTQVYTSRAAREPEFVQHYPFHEWIDSKMANVITGIREISQRHVVMLGWELPSDEDREIVNKGITDTDYLYASDFIRGQGAEVGVNILIQPPYIDNPEYKALLAVKRAVIDLHATRIYLASCIPSPGAPVAYNAYKKNLWNPVSATASSQILRESRSRYPDVEIVSNTMRVHWHHKKPDYYSPGRYTEEEKAAERFRVSEIAKQVFED
jgi:uncharacterized Fe-S cluster-containing MiaB family protein